MVVGPVHERVGHRTGRIYLVARVGPTVVGYAGMLFSADDGHVTTIAVDPAWHRGKIGTRLLLHLLRQGTVKGAKNFTLEVRMSNEGAQALYRAFGFAPAASARATTSRPTRTR